MSKWRKSFSFLLWINLCHHGESAFNLPHFDYWSRQNKIENLKYQNFLIRQIIKISKWQHVIHSRWRNSTMMTNSEIKLQIKVSSQVKLFRRVENSLFFRTESSTSKYGAVFLGSRDSRDIITLFLCGLSLISCNPSNRPANENAAFS